VQLYLAYLLFYPVNLRAYCVDKWDMAIFLHKGLYFGFLRNNRHTKLVLKRTSSRCCCRQDVFRCLTSDNLDYLMKIEIA